VVLTVDERHANVDRWVSGENTVVECGLNALVRRVDVFARNASARDLVDEFVTAHRDQPARA